MQTKWSGCREIEVGACSETTVLETVVSECDFCEESVTKKAQVFVCRFVYGRYMTGELDVHLAFGRD